MKLSRYIANKDDAQGYGYIAQKLLDGLRDAGAEILPPDAYGWDALLAISPPRSWITGPSFRPDLVMHTMFDMEPVPESWVHILNNVGLIWVPSQSSKDMFERAGVVRPIKVSGYALDDTFTIYDRSGRDPDRPYRVLVWGDSFATRKNVLQSVSVFIRANLPNAVVDVKIYDDAISADTILIEGQRDDRITLYNEKWSQYTLNDWLHTGDIGLYLSGGEGFGLMPFQMMGTGLPMIMPIHTGMAEYATSECVLSVPLKGDYICPSFSVQFNQTMIAREPDVDEATNLLRWAYENRTESYRVGMCGAAAVRQNTWASVGQTAYEFIEAYIRSL